MHERVVRSEVLEERRMDCGILYVSQCASLYLAVVLT